MPSFQKTILIGHVGKDPEIQKLQSGSSLAKFSLAVSEKYTNKQGKKVESTEWFNIEAWNKLAELAEMFIRKGDALFVECRQKTDEYETNGEKKRYTKHVATAFQFLSSKAKNDLPHKAQKDETDILPFDL